MFCGTVLPAKSDNGVMFSLQSYRVVESIEYLCTNPNPRKGLIYNLSIDSQQLKLSVQVNVLLNNCKQNTTSLSLLAGRTVHAQTVLKSLWCNG